MKNRWSDKEARKCKDELDRLVYRSRLIGEDPGLCLWGGGNTSAKTREKDFRGETVSVLRVKGSGSDMKSVTRRDFPAVSLEPIQRLLRKSEMTDEAMVDYVAHSLLDPTAPPDQPAPRPSIECLLHAFLPHASIDHSHADSILAVTNSVQGREAAPSRSLGATRPSSHPLLDQVARKIWGKELLWIPYIKPGFLLAKKLFKAFQKDPRAKGALLEKHGIITWGDSSKESYSRMIEMVSRAERVIRSAGKGRRAFGGLKMRPLGREERRDFILKFLPTLREALSRRERKILLFDDSPEVLEFCSSRLGPRVSQVGPATPDHMLRTKRRPLFLSQSPLKVTPSSLQKEIELYAERHRHYYARYKKPGMFMLDPYPAILLFPGVGMVACGKDRSSAEIAAEIYKHSIAVMRGAAFLGGYRSLAEPEAFEMEYWSLELYKLSLAPPEKELSRRVALVTGASGGIGRAISKALARSGAHVVLTDLDAKKVSEASREINQELRSEKTVGLRLDVTDEDEVREVFRTTLLTFGGLDLLVSNAGMAHIAPVEKMTLQDWEKSFQVNATGHFLVSREAVRILKEQRLGGSLIFIASKNILAPGKDFAAYSAAKSAEAQLARILAIESGEAKIRVNIINPDGVFQDSGLWSPRIRSDRAKSHGIRPSEIEEFYRSRNLMKVRILPEDVAEAVVFFASDRSAKTTGCILTVDGGLREAFPR